MDFYNDIITAKSWQTLQDLKRAVTFVLIGGWAVWLYTKALKSKDIDIIVSYDQLEKLKKRYPVVKNERLKKYEALDDMASIDIYLPHWSSIGMPVEDVLKKTHTIDTFVVPTVDVLLALKGYVYGQRKLTAKGQKDRLDILSLLVAQLPMQPLQNEITSLIWETKKIPELGINEYAWSKRKKLLLAS